VLPSVPLVAVGDDEPLLRSVQGEPKDHHNWQEKIGTKQKELFTHDNS
jgi:hypothetical protein